jgi:hypothetical protein
MKHRHDQDRPRRGVTRSTGTILAVGAIVVAVGGVLAGLHASGSATSTRVRALGLTSTGGLSATSGAAATPTSTTTHATVVLHKGSCQTPFSRGTKPTTRLPAPDVNLSWLPAGATVRYHRDCRFPGTTFGYVSLPGRANANTVPPTGIPIGVRPDPRGATYHPAGFISVVVGAGGRLPPPLPNQFGYKTVTTTINGHPARMSYPGKVLGGYHIEWLQNGDYVGVSVNRGRTPDGISGVPLSQLKQVAAGLQLG